MPGFLFLLLASWLQYFLTPLAPENALTYTELGRNRPAFGSQPESEVPK